MKKSILFLFAALLALTIAAPGFAQNTVQNAPRQGIFLDLGAGFGNAEMEVKVEDISASVDFNGFALDFKLGGFVNPNVAIYYIARGIAYTLEEDTEQLEDLDAINYFNGVGISYFVNPQAPSFYLMAGAGMGAIRLSDGDMSETESGAGLTLGLGYEFTRNWSVEASFMRAKVFSDTDPDLGLDMDIYAQNMAVTVNWLFY